MKENKSLIVEGFETVSTQYIKEDNLLYLSINGFTLDNRFDNCEIDITFIISAGDIMNVIRSTSWLDNTCKKNAQEMIKKELIKLNVEQKNK